MRGRRRPRPIALGLAVVTLALSFFGGCSPDSAHSKRYVVARTTGGRLVARLPLSDDHFALRYRHSIFGAPGIERFSARADGFELTGLSSPSEAVLDYYAIAGRRTRARGWWRLTPSAPPRYERLPLIATEKGRRTLLASGESVPLFESGRALHLTLRVTD